MKTSDIFRSAIIQKIYHPLTIYRRHVTQRKNRPRKRKIWDVGNSGASPGESCLGKQLYISPIGAWGWGASGIRSLWNGGIQQSWKYAWEAGHGRAELWWKADLKIKRDLSWEGQHGASQGHEVNSFRTRTGLGRNQDLVSTLRHRLNADAPYHNRQPQ